MVMNKTLFKVDILCVALFILWFFVDIYVLWAFVPFLVIGVVRFVVVVIWVISKTIDAVEKYGIFRKDNQENEVEEFWEFKE